MTIIQPPFDRLFRSVTKEQKEKENRKVAPIANIAPAGRPSSVQARPVHGILQDDIKAVCKSPIEYAFIKSTFIEYCQSILGEYNFLFVFLKNIFGRVRILECYTSHTHTYCITI